MNEIKLGLLTFQKELLDFAKVVKESFEERKIRDEKGDEFYYNVYLKEKWIKNNPIEAKKLNAV